MADAWYVRIGPKEYGPLTPEELKRMAKNGSLLPDSLVKKTEAGKWIAANKVKGLVFQPPPDAKASPEPAKVARETPAVSPPKDVLDCIPASMARNQLVFPLSKEKNVITLLTIAANQEEKEKWQFVLNCEVKLVAGTRQAIQELIDQCYGPAPAPQGAPVDPVPKAASQPSTSKERPGTTYAGPYFECSFPKGNALCSDDSCPCSSNIIPPGSGYLYISEEVVEFRKDALTETAAMAKIQDLQRKLGGVIVNPVVLASPILMCILAADRRNIDLTVAGNDAKHWWKTGKVPLRPTPLAAPNQGAKSTPTESKTPMAGPDAWRQLPSFEVPPIGALPRTSDGRSRLYDPSLDFFFRYFQSSHNTNPRNVDALAMLKTAVTGLRNGTPSEAPSALTSIVQMSEIAPQMTAKALQIRGILKAAASDPRAALDDLTAALEKHSSDDSDRAWSLLWRGRANAQVGNLKAAIDDFTTVVGMNKLKSIPYLEAIRATAELDLQEVSAFQAQGPSSGSRQQKATAAPETAPAKRPLTPLQWTIGCGAILLFLGLCGGCCTFAIIQTEKDKLETVKTADRFLELLRENKITEAHQSTSLAFQAEQNRDRFAAFVKEHDLAGPASWSNQRSVRILGGWTIDGYLSRKEGPVVPLTIGLVEESGVWKIRSLSRTPAEKEGTPGKEKKT